MSSVAIALVLAAALTHAGWNLLVKGAGDDGEPITWIAFGVGGLLLGPALVHEWRPVVGAWPFVVASATAEAAYVLLLTAAYRVGDLSVVYPIARGTAPLLLAVWTSVFLGQVPRSGGVAGIGLLAAGVAIVAATADRRPHGSEARRPWIDVALTLGVALCISTYSAVDGAAMRRAPAAAYEAAVFLLGALAVAPNVIRRVGWGRIRGVWRTRWRRVLLVGAGMAGGYVAILAAFRLAPVAYVGASREVSIVFAALAGWRVLGERLTIARLAGSLIIVAGIVSIVRFG